jgi:hypothetical protein
VVCNTLDNQQQKDAILDLEGYLGELALLATWPSFGDTMVYRKSASDPWSAHRISWGRVLSLAGQQQTNRWPVREKAAPKHPALRLIQLKRVLGGGQSALSIRKRML